VSFVPCAGCVVQPQELTTSTLSSAHSKSATKFRLFIGVLPN
jgi:hypothetical protein